MVRDELTIRMEVLRKLDEPMSVSRLAKEIRSRYPPIKKIVDDFVDDELLKPENNGPYIYYSRTRKGDEAILFYKAFKKRWGDIYKKLHNSII